MIKGTLIMALDFKKDSKAPHHQYSYRVGDIWYVVKYGPGYSNTWKVSEYDDRGLAWLKSIEQQGGR